MGKNREGTVSVKDITRQVSYERLLRTTIKEKRYLNTVTDNNILKVRSTRSVLKANKKTTVGNLTILDRRYTGL